MKPIYHTLKNGLRVILVPTGGTSITTLLLIGAGSRYENQKNNGIAHFFEHMAFKGSKNFPDSFTIASTIEGMGGVFNAYTSKDHTGYYIKATPDKLETMTKVLADMITASKLEPAEIEREKGVIIEEINMYEDTPARRVGDIFDQLLYPKSSLGMDIIGTQDHIQSFNRQTFLDYFSQLYFPNNAVFAIAGAISEDKKEQQKLIELMDKYFGAWEKDQISGFDSWSGKQSQAKVKTYFKKTEQAHFVLGFRAFGFNDPRRYTLSLLSAILGGGMSSRLFIEVRERRGLCYYISTSKDQYVDAGCLVTQAGVKCDKKTLNEAIQVVIQEHKNIASNISTGNFNLDEELVRAKEMIKGRILLSLEDTQNLASYYGTRMILGEELISPQEVIEKIMQVTKKDIITLAKDLVQEKNLNVAVIGPFNEEDIELS